MGHRLRYYSHRLKRKRSRHRQGDGGGLNIGRCALCGRAPVMLTGAVCVECSANADNLAEALTTK